jgi:hypothetical protein
MFADWLRSLREQWERDIRRHLLDAGISGRTIDASNLSGVTTAVARVGVRKNSGGSTYFRRRVNLVEGIGVTLTLTDDGANEEVDVMVSATGSSAGVFNVREYGAAGDGVADDAAACQSAIDAAVTAGGGDVVWPAGTYKLGSGLTVTGNVRIRLIGRGATLKPQANVTAIRVTQALGGTSVGCLIDGFVIDGDDLAGSIGIQLKDTDRPTVRNCWITDCAIGISFAVTTAGSTWVEGAAIYDTFIHSCTNGVTFERLGGVSTASFGETVMVNVGINDCTVGLSINNACNMYRSSIKGMTIWCYAGQKALYLNGVFHGTIFEIGLESFSGSGTTGIHVGPNASNTHLMQLYTNFTGPFGTPYNIYSGKYIRFQEGQRLWTNAGQAYFEGIQINDTAGRLVLAGWYAGGGGIEAGPGGTGSRDVNLYRKAANVWATDDVFVLGSFTTAALPAAATAGAGALAYVSDAASKLQISDGTAWYAVMINPMTAAGDLILGGTSGSPQRLAVGSEGKVLKVVSGSPNWATHNAGHAIEDEGIALTQRDALNFTGSGVAATDDAGAGKTVVTVNRWEPLTNGVAATPELVYADGDVIMVEETA